MVIKSFKLFINEGELFNNINSLDIIECIKNKGVIKAKLVKNNTEHNPDDELVPYNYDNGQIEVEYNGNIYYVDIKDVTYVNF